MGEYFILGLLALTTWVMVMESSLSLSSLTDTMLALTLMRNGEWEDDVDMREHRDRMRWIYKEDTRGVYRQTDIFNRNIYTEGNKCGYLYTLKIDNRGAILLLPQTCVVYEL